MVREMETLPFLLATGSLAGAFAVAVWAAGWRPALGVIGATVVSVTTVQMDGPTAALALLLLAVLVAIRFPWREPITLEVVVDGDGRLPPVRRVGGR